ncbi:hypothetical protein LQ938_11665 [Microbacterium sp. cx-55]|uniref:hypothetical protein n=1 Tax=Microbacterium sp. cx-55 TaxID=2875948 RepID=UPI001CBD84DA|nr:hypothetical protein [Microbacterium sp. cx-55]MBZ4488070.1 hypothetical protein [Microbacterium sp. cx-55]UGB34524.1 hypothetical protein LQ938_11665 [Microbacterium sp. cx-55]
MSKDKFMIVVPATRALPWAMGGCLILMWVTAGGALLFGPEGMGNFIFWGATIVLSPIAILVGANLRFAGLKSAANQIARSESQEDPLWLFSKAAILPSFRDSAPVEIGRGAIVKRQQSIEVWEIRRGKSTKAESWDLVSIKNAWSASLAPSAVLAPLLRLELGDGARFEAELVRAGWQSAIGTSKSFVEDAARALKQ